jgi:hypothetical protein
MTDMDALSKEKYFLRLTGMAVVLIVQSVP